MIAVLVIIITLNIQSGFPTLLWAAVVWPLHARLESPIYDQYVISWQSIMDSPTIAPGAPPTSLRIGIDFSVARIAAIGAVLVKTGLI